VRTTQAANKLLGSVGQGANQLDLKPINFKSLIPTTIGDTLAPDVARRLGDYAKQALRVADCGQTQHAGPHRGPTASAVVG
jgi:hypothetical protein